MELELPDGKILSVGEGATGADAAAAIGPGLARAALAVKVDGELRDLSRPLPSENGPLMSVRTPILTLPSEIWACAAPARDSNATPIAMPIRFMIAPCSHIVALPQ